MEADLKPPKTDAPRKKKRMNEDDESPPSSLSTLGQSSPSLDDASPTDSEELYNNNISHSLNNILSSHRNEQRKSDLNWASMYKRLKEFKKANNSVIVPIKVRDTNVEVLSVFHLSRLEIL